MSKDRLTVLEGHKEPALGCQRTSPVFPGAILAATPNVSPIFLKAVTVAALSMPPSRGGDVWGIVNDFSAVEAVYRKLALGPYAYLAQRDWKSLVWEYRWVLVGLVALLLGLVLHSVRAQDLVRRRTEELRKAQKAEQTERERAYLMERTGIVSGLCSMLVHEVRQPLSALIAYAGGLRMLLRQKADTQSPYAEAAENILTQARRVDEIVEHVRGYAKEKRHQGEDMAVKTLMTRVVNNFKSSSASAGIRLQVSDEVGADAVIHVEPLEAELALVRSGDTAGREGTETGRLYRCGGRSLGVFLGAGLWQALHRRSHPGALRTAPIRPGRWIGHWALLGKANCRIARRVGIVRVGRRPRCRGRTSFSEERKCLNRWCGWSMTTKDSWAGFRSF